MDGWRNYYLNYGPFFLNGRRLLFFLLSSLVMTQHFFYVVDVIFTAPALKDIHLGLLCVWVFCFFFFFVPAKYYRIHAIH